MKEIKDKNGTNIYVGDTVVLTDYNNKKYIYKVVNSRTFGMILVSVNDQPGKWYPCDSINISYEKVKEN